MADPNPAIITTPCGCFFQGRELVVSPSCADHTDDLDDEQVEYTFDQLSDRAKERARDDYRSGDYPGYDWWDCVFEDASQIADMLGITIADKPVKLMSSKVRYEPSIYFSGFCSQGDGACFEGGWAPDDDPMSILTRVLEHAPQDETLHDLALGFAHLSERCALAPGTWARVSHSGHYYHSRCTTIECEIPTPDEVDYGNELQLMVWNALVESAGLEFYAFENEITGLLRDFMDWIYSQLEAEHDYLTSDEHIDEMLADYTFDEDGNQI